MSPVSYSLRGVRFDGQRLRIDAGTILPPGSE
jgi:hypothetical protein